MSRVVATSEKIRTDENHAESRPRLRHQGIIVFCETKLCYEKGIKAWIFLGPYLLGALGLEMIIDARRANAPTGFWPWIGFLAYLVLFPPAWQRILKFVTSKKAAPIQSSGPSAVQRP